MNELAFENYKRVVNLLLLDFQFIEELLKIVTSAAYEAIRRTAPPHIQFRPNRRNLEKESLGKLIQKYEEISGNEVLIQKLRDIASDRNFCAHRAFLLTLEEQQNASFLAGETRRLETLRQRSQDCVMTLQGEFEQFSQALHEAPNITVERDAPEAARPSP
jgi:hypothetical protein